MKQWCVGVVFATAGSLCASIPVAAQQRVAVFGKEAVQRTVAETPLGAKLVTVSVQNVSLKQAVDAISKAAGVPVQYPVALLEAYRAPVTVKVDRLPLSVALGQVFAGKGLAVVADGVDQLMIIESYRAAPVTDGTVVGRISNAKTKQPITNATITVAGTTTTTHSAEGGRFRLSLPPGEYVLSVRALGMTRTARTIIVVGDQAVTADIELEPATNILGEVVVTGTVVATERKAIPTPITVITAEDIEKRGITRIEQLLRGEVPGVLVLDQGIEPYMRGDLSAPGQLVQAKVYSRGSASLDGSANPMKTYIDGVELVDPSYLGTIDPATIERIEVITGPQAATIYGAGAMGGVMQIFTKDGGSGGGFDLTLSMKYGVLESNLSSGKTPVHNDVFSLAGNAGTQISYSGNLSYQYQGQWQPNVYSRRLGASLGASYASSQVTVRGSYSVTRGTNGTFGMAPPGAVVLAQEGIITNDARYSVLSTHVSVALSQTSSLNIDYRPSARWQHHATIGRSQNNFELTPSYIAYGSFADSLLAITRNDGWRTTASYNSTAILSAGSHVSSTITVGANGAWGDGLRVQGSLPAVSASSFLSAQVNRASGADSWGVFSNLQTGFFDRLFVTLGVRGERNKAYGKNRRTDWTPTNGVTYTMEAGDFSIKILGSYGRSTRTPDETMQLPITTVSSSYTPASFVSQLPAPDLRPEYSRGPQGGVEVYYRDWGSFTINRYRQTVTDLIQRLTVDSIMRISNRTGNSQWAAVWRYENIAKIRQQGWEATAAVTLGMLSVKGTYSWNDSRIVNVVPTTYVYYRPGDIFSYVPSHFGNVVVNFSHGGSSATLVTNYVGASNRDISQVSVLSRVARAPMYTVRRASMGHTNFARGYLKSNLVLSQRINPRVSFLVNVVNLGNSYGTEQNNFYVPTLGRTTTFGLSLRH